MCAMSKKVLVIKDETHCAISSHSHKKQSASSEVLCFFVCVRRTQHRLAACGQHHFERSENIVFNKRTQNDVALRQTVLCFAQTMWAYAQ